MSQCPNCGAKDMLVSREDEDSYWSKCTKCGKTCGHMIKYGFG